MNSKRFFSLLCAGALTLGCCVGASAEDMTQKLGLTPEQKAATQFRCMPCWTLRTNRNLTTPPVA